MRAAQRGCRDDGAKAGTIAGDGRSCKKSASSRDWFSGASGFGYSMSGTSITLQRIGLLKIGHGFGHDSYSGLSNNELAPVSRHHLL
jgi:hypothetical protein